MNRLSTEQALKDSATSDSNSVSSLKLTYKALSDVSCLSGFKNLERLDLSFNNLTSLEGLKACVNLKWLAVVQNKLESLRGIEGLSKLTVLNAGKNKLGSMDEVGSLLTLRALILNDNEILTICRLDQMKDLNTLVLSRNPIHTIGESLVKVKSVTKLSLSNCQLQTIGSSLKSCIELKELRLAHNRITTLPNELAQNKKLQNLDLGNNAISRWLDLKVLTSLANLKNLNLQGNPVAEKEKLAKRIKIALPNLQIFNAKPTNKYTKNKNCETGDAVDDYSINAADKLDVLEEEKSDVTRKKKSKHHVSDSIDDHLDNARGIEGKKKLKQKRQETDDNISEKVEVIGKKKSKYHLMDQSKDDPSDNTNIVDVQQKLKRKRKETNDIVSEKEVLVCKDVNIDETRRNWIKGHEDSTNNSHFLGVKKEPKRKKIEKLSKEEVPAHVIDGEVEKKLKQKSKVKKGELNIDDPEASFTELFSADLVENSKYEDEKKIADNTVQDKNLAGGLVTFPVKKRKQKNHGSGPALDLSPSAEIGMGGPSTWGEG